MGLEGGLNPYAYAGNNPVMNADPSGLFSLIPDAQLGGISGIPGFNLANLQVDKFVNNTLGPPMANVPAYGAKRSSGTDVLAMGNCGTPGGPCGRQPGAMTHAQSWQMMGTGMQIAGLVPTPASPFLFFGGEILSGIGIAFDDTKSNARKIVDIALPYGAGRIAKGALTDPMVSDHVADAFGTVWGITTEKMIGVVNEDSHQQEPRCTQQYVCR